MNLFADKHKNTVDFDLKSTVFVTLFEPMVENTGIEPVTSCMPCKRSPS